jgi:hypothetical protein
VGGQEGPSTGDVDLADPGEVGGIEVVEAGPPGDAGVGDQTVDPAVLAPEVVGQRRPAGGVGDVELPVSRRSQVLGRRGLQVDGHHRCTLGGQQPRLGRALPLPGAGDHDHLARQPAVHVRLPGTYPPGTRSFDPRCDPPAPRTEREPAAGISRVRGKVAA